MPDKPRNLRSLTDRINNLARAQSTPVRRIQRAVANTVVGQMMPPGVIKGGTGMKLRVGELSSRYTPDFDAARAAEVAFENYVSEFEASLAEGWGGFTGTLVALEARQPAGVPEEDVMKPFRIRLAYEGSHWLTVEFDSVVTRSEAPNMPTCGCQRISPNSSKRLDYRRRRRSPSSPSSTKLPRSFTHARREPEDWRQRPRA